VPLRLARTTLNDAVARSTSLVSKAERTVDPKAKIKLLQEAAALLTKAKTVRQQIDGLEASLERLGIAREVYENQMALEKQQVELAAQRRLELQQANLTKMAMSTAAIPTTNQPATRPTSIEATAAVEDVVRDVVGSFGSDLLKQLAVDGINMTAAHSSDFGWVIFNKDVLAFKTELLAMDFSKPGAMSSAVEKIGLDAVADVVATRITRGALELVFGDDVDVDFVMEIAPSVAGLIKTGVATKVALDGGATVATRTTPGAVIVAGVVTSIKVAQAARAAKALSHEEDDNFASVAASIETISQLGALAGSGMATATQKQQMATLRASTITSAAEAIRQIYGGTDGPVIEDMFRTAIKARELLDKGDTRGAQALVAQMKSKSLYADPLDVTNNFFENIFMHRKPDAERAYDILIGYADLGALNL